VRGFSLSKKFFNQRKGTGSKHPIPKSLPSDIGPGLPMNDLLQFNSRRDFRFLVRITQGDESDDLNVFWNPEYFLHLRFIKGPDPAGSKAEARRHGHHISTCQGHIISSILSLSGIETEDEDDWSLFHMGRFDEEETGHLSDLSSRLRICHHNEVPRLEICSGRSPSPCLKDLEEKILRDGFVLIDPDGPSGF